MGDRIAYVIYNTPQQDKNLLYWGHFDAPDPFFALTVGGKKLAFVSELEYGRCKASSMFDEVFLRSDAQKRSALAYPQGTPWSAFFRYLQQQYAIDRFVVPNDFPATVYAQCYQTVPLGFDAAAFETMRAIKTASEIDEIRKACKVTADILGYAKSILHHSTVHNHQLEYDGSMLTSERLRTLMEQYGFNHGACAEDTIVAGGEQAVHPHHRGEGPLYEGQLIVLDCFPYLKQSGYYGDMTRTVVKGYAKSEQMRMYQCVRDCQQALIERIHPGVLTSDLMQFALDFFERAGFGLKQTAMGCEGFIHSVGHGLGLGLHEYPSVGAQAIALEAGMVITVEPGLYFHTIGGVRIEDDVVVTPTGCERLSDCSYELCV